MAKVAFESPYPPSECLRRLQTAAERDAPVVADMRLSPAVLARIGDDRFRLRVRRSFGRNSFDPVFYGRLESSPTGARIRGRFTLHPLILVFLIVWVTGVSLIGALTVLATQTTFLDRWVVREPGAGSGIGLTLGLLLFAAALFLFGKWRGQHAEATIRAFLADALRAREIPPAA